MPAPRRTWPVLQGVLPVRRSWVPAGPPGRRDAGGACRSAGHGIREDRRNAGGRRPVHAAGAYRPRRARSGWSWTALASATSTSPPVRPPGGDRAAAPAARPVCYHKQVRFAAQFARYGIRGVKGPDAYYDIPGEALEALPRRQPALMLWPCRGMPLVGRECDCSGCICWSCRGCAGRPARQAWSHGEQRPRWRRCAGDLRHYRGSRQEDDFPRAVPARGAQAAQLPGNRGGQRRDYSRAARRACARGNPECRGRVRRRGYRPSGQPDVVHQRGRHRHSAVPEARRGDRPAPDAGVLPRGATIAVRAYRRATGGGEAAARRPSRRREAIRLRPALGTRAEQAAAPGPREDQILRVDHFLGKEPVIGIEYLRFANFALAELWDRKSVSCVQITMAEDFGVEGRGRSTTPSARSGTSCRITCCRCLRSLPWTPRPGAVRMTCRTRRRRCSARCRREPAALRAGPVRGLCRDSGRRTGFCYRDVRRAAAGDR